MLDRLATRFLNQENCWQASRLRSVVAPERDDLSANGNFATSWIAASPTPGIFERDFLLADVNQDGIVSFLDIAPFISILSSNEYLLEADVNQDGFVDFLDINPFIDELAR